MTAQVPNPGTLVAGDPHDYALGAPGNKALLLKPDVADVSPGSVTVTTRPTQRARASWPVEAGGPGGSRQVLLMRRAACPRVRPGRSSSRGS